MNIWILNHYATPPDTPGGTRHFDFAKEMGKRGHRVSIFASGFSHRTRREERLEERQGYRREKIGGVEFVWLRTSPYYKGNDWRRVRNMLSYSCRAITTGLRIKEKPDVILSSSPHLLAGLAGWVLAKLKGGRFVFEVRDLWPQALVEIGNYGDKSLVVRLLRALEKFLYRRARKIVVLMPRGSEYMKKLGVPSNKVVYIPNGIDPELFADSSAELPPELTTAISSLKSQGKLLVGYTGAHGRANALGTIIKAARTLQERKMDKVHFLLVGDGPERERLIRKAEDWKLNNISFYRSVPKYAMPALLGSIDIAVIPRKRLGLGKYGTSINKLFDYMASARPVIWGAKLARNPVSSAGCGLSIALENPRQMTEAIVQLSRLSDNERREMGMRGYEYVMKYHSIPVLTDRLLEVMEEVTGESNRAGGPGKEGLGK
jgi:glycosyltransferase involved in cell wall biosynthesis